MAYISVSRPLDAPHSAHRGVDLSGLRTAGLYVAIGFVALVVALPAAFATAASVPMFEECYEASCTAP